MSTPTALAPSPDVTLAEDTRQALRLSLSLPLAPVAPTPLATTQAESQQGFGLKALFSRFFTQELRARLQKMAPWLFAGGVLGLNLVLHAPTFVLGATIAALTIRIVKAIIRSNPLCQRLWQTLLKQAGVPEHKLPWLSVCFGSGAWLGVAFPSQALFFQAAETYMTTLINGAAGAGGNAAGAQAMVPLIFGVLRVIFVLYVGIALVRVINAFRNDEDWQTAARIPLITVLCIVIGDAISGMIVQGG